MKQVYEYKNMQSMKAAGNYKYVLDMDGNGAHEELARQIALQGREWSKTYWRREDIIAYSYRMFLEYARIMSLDREAMAYQGEVEIHFNRWKKDDAIMQDSLLQ
ncbi:glycosyltransferase family 90 protein [Lentinula edodes]|uniref:Glycosyltransferase family 90 protein n=1 Tax=Lentinula edodes TaxID=5353 RepID=A0A1Q3E706_LENED|nr:glycosyltransferase family 90 protein [Lentinula edodes]